VKRAWGELAEVMGMAAWVERVVEAEQKRRIENRGNGSGLDR
jgi:hypothetical protein